MSDQALRKRAMGGDAKAMCELGVELVAIGCEHLEAGYRWVKKSSDSGYEPAIAALANLLGRLPYLEIEFNEQINPEPFLNIKSKAACLL